MKKINTIFFACVQFVYILVIDKLYFVNAKVIKQRAWSRIFFPDYHAIYTNMYGNFLIINSL